MSWQLVCVPHPLASAVAASWLTASDGVGGDFCRNLQHYLTQPLSQFRIDCAAGSAQEISEARNLVTSDFDTSLSASSLSASASQFNVVVRRFDQIDRGRITSVRLGSQ
jgi:hypothetical protein